MGIDWSEGFHLVAVGRWGEGRRCCPGEHTPAVVARIAGLEPDSAELRVVQEIRHGLLVATLVDAG